MGLKPDQIFQKVCFMNWMNGVWKTEKKVFKKHNQYYIWPFVHFKKNVFVNGFDGVLLLQEKKIFWVFSAPWSAWPGLQWQFPTGKSDYMRVEVTFRLISY